MSEKNEQLSRSRTSASQSAGQFSPERRGSEAAEPRPGNSPQSGEGMAAEPFIGKPEVARRLGRTARCVEQMMARGILPFYRWDSQAAFRWSEVQQALDKHFRVVLPDGHLKN